MVAVAPGKNGTSELSLYRFYHEWNDQGKGRVWVRGSNNAFVRTRQNSRAIVTKGYHLRRLVNDWFLGTRYVFWVGAWVSALFSTVRDLLL